MSESCILGSQAPARPPPGGTELAAKDGEGSDVRRDVRRSDVLRRPLMDPIPVIVLSSFVVFMCCCFCSEVVWSDDDHDDLKKNF